MTHIEYAKKLNRLSDTYRYPTVMRLNKESVAEHSYHTSMMVMLLEEDYKFDVPTAVMMALSHDVVEIDLTDIPHPVKKRFPHIADSMVDAEIVLSDDLPGLVKRVVRTFLYNDSVEHQIVHFADAMSCLVYSESEVKLGNTYMQRVYDESVVRIEQLSKELEQWKK